MSSEEQRLEEQKSHQIEPLPVDGNKMYAGAQDQDRLERKYVDLIMAEQRKSAESVLATCGHYADADRQLDQLRKKKLISDLRIDRSGYERRVLVGKDRRLQKIPQFLPPHHTTLYELAHFSDSELAEAVESKIIHPAVTRSRLKAWIETRREPHRVDDHRSNAASNAVRNPSLYIPPDMADDIREQFEEALKDLCESFGVDVVFPKYEAECRAEDRETERFNRRIDALLRLAGRKVVLETEKQRLEDRPADTTKDDWRRQRWPYTPEDIAIGRGADLFRVREVLDRIGMGDAFGTIQEDAYRRVRQERP
jgi:hypothetical protein